MPRFDEMPEYRNREKRTTHDLSHKYGFTATVAHLLPVFHDFLNPGETVDLSFQYNLRTQPLQSAAMVDINSHVEYFFVPMNLLFEPFGNKYFNIRDSYSSLYNLGVGQSAMRELPVLNFNEFIEFLLDNQNDTVPEGFENWRNSVIRLFDHLGYNTQYIIHGSDPDAGVPVNWNPSVFPYPILAYNCIYQYYYRLDTRQNFDQFSFNWDRFYNTSTPIGNSEGVFPYIQLYYRPLENDYFTDVKVSPIVDVLNLDYKSSLNTVNNWLTRSSSVRSYPVIKSGSVGSSGVDILHNAPSGIGNTPANSTVTEFGFNTDYSGETPFSTLQPNGYDINTANIRALFANEKLWSITGRARKHYDDQVLAHFGFKVPHDPKHEISCFGHDKGKIHIGEVIQTAQAYDPNSESFGGLGEIAGKGYGSMQNKPHRFTAPCHGVVMAILSFTPDYTYGGSYLKANAVSKPEDFFIPEYDHLGMQPLFGYEGNPQEVSSRNSIVGWQYRYEQWKRRFNRVSPAFTGVGSLDSWMLDKKPNKAVNAVNTESYINYLYKPSDLNQIMLVNYVTTNMVLESGELDQATLFDGDPFVVDGYIYCKKVSIMSDYSLPRLDA